MYNRQVSQCVKWYEMALQDTDPLRKYEHMVLSQSYLNVSRHLAPDEVIEQQTGMHIRALQKRINSSVHGLEKSFSKVVKPQSVRMDARRASWL